MRAVIQTRLLCPCGNMQTIWRRANRQRRAGHHKPLWCFKCMKRTLHTEQAQQTG